MVSRNGSASKRTACASVVKTSSLRHSAQDGWGRPHTGLRQPAVSPSNLRGPGDDLGERDRGRRHLG